MRLAVVPAAVAGALGLYQLGDPSLWIDEAYTAERTAFSYDRLMDDLQWAHFTLVKAWASFAGTSEEALRLPSVIGAVVAVTLLYGLARRMFDERVAFVASLLLAVNPFVVQWSQQARAYSILLALAIGSTWLLLRAREQETVAAWAWYGVAVTVLIYWQTFSALLFLPVHLAIAWRNPRALLTWSLALLATTPWLIAFVGHEGEELPTTWIARPTLSSLLGFLRDAPGAWGVGVVLAVVGAFYVRQHRRLLVAWAALPFGIALLASIYDPVFVSRYLIVSCPAFAMLGAIALVRLAGLVRTVAVGWAVVGTSVGLAVWYAPNGSQNWIGEDWKSATAFVMRDGGAVVVPSLAEAAYVYYGGRPARTGWMLYRSAAPTQTKPGEQVVSFGAQLHAVRTCDTKC